jgi:hypothetical protein
VRPHLDSSETIDGRSKRDAPVSLGKIAEGGQLVQARDKSWTPLIFQDLFKKEQ